MGPFLLAIDQGTTSSRAILFNARGRTVATAQRQLPQSFPYDGWVEHDPLQIWQDVLACCREVLSKSHVTIEQVAGVGITNQRETTVVWERKTGNPIYPAIVWQDRRTAEYCEQKAQESGFVEKLQYQTGLLLDPYFSATKIAWILDHVPNARTRAENGELAFGTIDTYLIWQLTKGKQHKTDATNASRTLLYNIHEGCWDDTLLSAFTIPRSLLPDICNSADNFGLTAPEWLGKSISIAGVAGDQQAALIGQTCFAPGETKSTYGTGCFLMLNTGSEALLSSHKLLTTVGYQLDNKRTYALEGSIFMAGATVQWMRDSLQLFDKASQSESLAKQAHEHSKVFLIPAFTGLGAPYWDPYARGALLGLTRDTGIAEIVAAGLESVCYQTKDLQKAMEQDGVRPNQVRVDGGMCKNDYVMGFLADILGCDVQRPVETETTALGAAYLAGLQTGVFRDLEQLRELWQAERCFAPTIAKQQRDGRYAAWLEAVSRVKTQ